MEKLCTKCGEMKPPDCFRLQIINGKKYYRKQCKDCINSEKRDLHWLNKAHENANSRRRYHKNKARAKECHDAWMKLHPEYNKKQWTRHKHKAAARRKDQIDCCADTYIKNQLRQKGFHPEHITPELIGVQRYVIKIKRLAKEIQG